MQHTQLVSDGVRKFIRLTGFRADPAMGKWTRDEFDLIEVLEVTKQLFHDTETMLGLKMYKGQDFDAVEDVKRNIEEYLLAGRDQKEIAAQRRKHLTMYHLVVEPVIDSFKGMNHEDILSNVNSLIDGVINEISTVDINTTYDDAIVTRAQVHQMIREREAKRKAELFKRRKVSKPRRKQTTPKDDEEIITLSMEDRVDLSLLL